MASKIQVLKIEYKDKSGKINEAYFTGEVQVEKENFTSLEKFQFIELDAPDDVKFTKLFDTQNFDSDAVS